MKKTTFLLVLVFVASSVFGMQEAFNTSSYEYQQVYALCRAAGVETRQLVAPISADQIINILNSIPDGRLTDSEIKVKNELIAHLKQPTMLYGKDDYGFDAIVTSCQDLFFHTADEEVLLNESVETRRDILPFLAVGGEVYFSDYFYGTFTFENTESVIDRKSKFSFNYNFDDFNIEISSPYKAYVSLGKSNFNFMMGREQLSLGKGKTGTLLLGDNFLFEDFAKVSYFNKMFSYDMTLITFDNSNDSNHSKLEVFDHDKDAHQLVIIHQFSFQPLKWMNISVAEGMLQYGKNILGDLSIISPFMLLHNVNSYMKGSANNFFGVDLSFAVAKGWEVNASLFFDQIQQKQELNNGKPGNNTAPNANAFLLNTIYSTEILGGMADFYVEGVYTSPAVYLKDARGYNSSYDYWDIDLIVGNALTNDAGSDVSYLGYKYGPDTIVLATGFDYSNQNKLQLSFDAIYKIHGEKGLQLSNYTNQNDCNGVGPDYYYEVSPTGIPEYRLSLVTTAKYRPFDWLTVNSQAGLISAWNYHNEEGKKFNDFQFALGVTINPLQLAKSFIVK